MDAGIMPHESNPITVVMLPSMRKSHCQPDQPWRPLICRTPAAMKDPRI
jgi:hypothetical protein